MVVCLSSSAQEKMHPRPNHAALQPKPTAGSAKTKANSGPGQGAKLAQGWLQPTLWYKTGSGQTLLQPRSCPAPAKPTSSQGQARGMMTGKEHNKLRNLELNRRWPPMLLAGNNQKCKNNESKRWFGLDARHNSSRDGSVNNEKRTQTCRKANRPTRQTCE